MPLPTDPVELHKLDHYIDHVVSSVTERRSTDLYAMCRHVCYLLIDAADHGSDWKPADAPIPDPDTFGLDVADEIAVDGMPLWAVVRLFESLMMYCDCDYCGEGDDPHRTGYVAWDVFTRYETDRWVPDVRDGWRTSGEDDDGFDGVVEDFYYS